MEMKMRDIFIDSLDEYWKQHISTMATATQNKEWQNFNEQAVRQEMRSKE